jgi:hypothetical protein
MRLRSTNVCLLKQRTSETDHQWLPVNRKYLAILSLDIKSCSKLLLSQKIELYRLKLRTLLSKALINLSKMENFQPLTLMNKMSDKFLKALLKVDANEFVILCVRSDRSASVNVSKSAQYKQIVNLSISPFTNPCKVWFVEKRILVDKFLAHTIVADRGKEGSDIVNGQSPKDLDTIVIVLAHTKATIAKVIKRNSVALLLPMPERTQLFSNCLTIVMRSFGLWTSDREEYLY